jgi:molybdenum cofactor biosynthesis enzyme MoaA
VQVCCTSEERDNNVRTDAGTRLNIRDVASVPDTMNLKYMRELRLQLQRGEWPDYCFRCRAVEEAGGKSRRMFEIDRFAADNEAMLRDTAKDGSILSKVSHLDLRLGNTCNLSCRMCSPISSSKWLREWIGLGNNPFTLGEETGRRLEGKPWYKDADVFERLLGEAEHFEFVHFAGGEPLIIPEMKEFLRALVNRGHSKKIRLSYNTNFTIISDELIELWRSFAGVHLYISLDGFGETNDLIRAHSRWQTMSDNLARLDRSVEEWNISEAMFCTTVQALNVLRLPELYEFTLGFKNIRRLPHLVMLHEPHNLAVSVLPEEWRKEAISRLLALRERLEKVALRPEEAMYLQDFAEVLQALERDGSELWPEFLSRNLEMDAPKGQDFLSVFPEFAADAKRLLGLKQRKRALSHTFEP